MYHPVQSWVSFLNKSPYWWLFKAPFVLKISPIKHHSHTFVCTHLPQLSQRPSFKTFIRRQPPPSHVSHLCTNPFFISSRRSTLTPFSPPFLRSLSSFICRSCLSLVIVVLFFLPFSASLSVCMWVVCACDDSGGACAQVFWESFLSAERCLFVNSDAITF